MASAEEIGGMCRFYDKEFPDVEESVIVNVKRIAEMGAYVQVRRRARVAARVPSPTPPPPHSALPLPCTRARPPPPLQLLEYNNLEGMILLSELSRRRIRSINKLLRVGKNEVVMVIRVDKEKKYIDLSKRRVSGDDIRRADERFNKSKSVHGVLRHVSMKLRVPMLSLYERVVWPLSRKYGHALDAFQLSVADPDAIFSPLEGVTEEEKREFLDFIKVRMTPQPLKIRADIKVFCFAYEGVEAVKEALMAALALSTKEVEIKVQLIAPPLYVMLTSTADKELGIASLNAAIEEARRVLTAKGGEVQVEMEPTVTTAQDDSQLDRMLEQLKEDEEGEEGEEEEDERGPRKAEGGGAGGGGAGGGGEEDEGLGSADFETLGASDFTTVRVPLAAAAGGGAGSAGAGAGAAAPGLTALEKLRAMQAAATGAKGASSASGMGAGGGGVGSSGGSSSSSSGGGAGVGGALGAAAGEEGEGEGAVGAGHAPADLSHVFNAKEQDLQTAQIASVLMGKKKKVKKAVVTEDD